MMYYEGEEVADVDEENYQSLSDFKTCIHNKDGLDRDSLASFQERLQNIIR